MDKQIEKQTIKVEVFKKTSSQGPILFHAIKGIVQDDDVIKSGYEEGFYSENNSHDGYFYMIVERKRLETDEELAERVEKRKQFVEEAKQRRYENYLKLKEEFEVNNKNQ